MLNQRKDKTTPPFTGPALRFGIGIPFFASKSRYFRRIPPSYHSLSSLAFSVKPFFVWNRIDCSSNTARLIFSAAANNSQKVILDSLALLWCTTTTAQSWISQQPAVVLTSCHGKYYPMMGWAYPGWEGSFIRLGVSAFRSPTSRPTRCG